jgi:hypothetical protein
MLGDSTYGARTFGCTGANHDRCGKNHRDQFIGLEVARPENIAIWLNGYYHGKWGSTIIDVQQLKEQPQKMTSYCLYTDRNGSVMESSEKMLSQGK